MYINGARVNHQTKPSKRGSKLSLQQPVSQKWPGSQTRASIRDPDWTRGGGSRESSSTSAEAGGASVIQHAGRFFRIIFFSKSTFRDLHDPRVPLLRVQWLYTVRMCVSVCVWACGYRRADIHDLKTKYPISCWLITRVSMVPSTAFPPLLLQTSSWKLKLETPSLSLHFTLLHVQSWLNSTHRIPLHLANICRINKFPTGESKGNFMSKSFPKFKLSCVHLKRYKTEWGCS